MRLVLVIIFSVVAMVGMAQQPDTTNLQQKRAKVKAKYQLESMTNDTVFNTVDTTLSNYYLNVPNVSIGYAAVGEFGLANRPLFPEIGSQVGFNRGSTAIDWYNVTREKVRYYKVLRPYSKIFYSQGSNEEQRFNIMHNQNIGPNFNVGIEYSTFGNDGLYSGQSSGHNYFLTHFKYQTKNGRYGIMGHFLLNEHRMQENGGVLNDSLFENDEIAGSRLFVEVNLDSADQTYENQSFFVNQYVDFGKVTYFAKNDSDTVSYRKFDAASRLYYSMYYNNEKNIYEHTTSDSSFYWELTNPLTPNYLLDYQLFNVLENKIGWTTLNRKKCNGKFTLNNIYGSFWAKHQMINYNQFKLDTTILNYIVGGGIGLVNFKWGKATANGSYVLGERNTGDYKVSLNVNIFPDTSVHDLDVQVSYQSKTPDFKYTNFSSNYVSWDNKGFTKEVYAKQQIAYNNRKWRLGLRVSSTSLTNFVYFDTLALPAQANANNSNGQFWLIRAELNKKFTFFKRMHFDTKMVYQNPTDGRGVLRVPEFWAFGSLYYENKIFKKALLLRLGVDVSYHTAYYADAYMPLFRQFHLQNEKLVGNYPYLDVHIQMKVRRARAYFKLYHINAGWHGRNYYSTPHYPMPDLAFRFGISWTMLE